MYFGSIQTDEHKKKIRKDISVFRRAVFIPARVSDRVYRCMHYVFAIHVTTANAGQGTEKEETRSMHQRHNSYSYNLSIPLMYASGS